MGEEGAEAGGHVDAGADFEVLLVGEGGEVDGVLDDAELEVVADLAGELDADGFLGFVGGAGDVGGEQDVGEAVVGGFLEGLLVKTSRAAPATLPDLSASARAASTMSSPRAQLMMRTPGFMMAMEWALIMPSVCVVRPTWRVRKSEELKTWSSEVRVTPCSRAMTGAMKGS